MTHEQAILSILNLSPNVWV